MTNQPMSLMIVHSISWLDQVGSPFLHVFPPSSHDSWISMGFPWDFHGISMGFPWDFHGIPPGGGPPAVWAPGWAPGGATAARGTTGDGGDTKATGDPQFGDAGGGAWNADVFFSGILWIWVCLKIGYIPNYSHLIGIMIINHWV